MYIYVPDQHPGRCNNYRHIDGQMERCLDYEATPHVCSFPEPPPKHYVWTATTHTTYTIPTPKPWVKPGDEIDDSR